MADWLSNCTKQDWGTNGGSWTRQPAIICIHSTEGNSFPGYNSGQSAPHFTIDVRTNEKRQHVSMGLAARALANPSSYGTSNGVRLSGSAWNAYKGILGHQHVPENDHGDPGDINIAAIMGITP